MVTRPTDMNFLGKLGYVLQSTADPQFNQRYMQQLAQQQQAEQLNQFRQGQLGLLQENQEMARDKYEFSKQQAMENQIRQERATAALGNLASTYAGGGQPSPEQINAFLMAGGSPTALGNLQSVLTPQAPELIETYDPATGQMVYTPKSQAIGLPATAPRQAEQRRIIEQDGVQYYADTGEPVIKAPITSPKPELTAGEEKVDKEFAKEYVALQATGGLADVDKQINQLEGALNTLKSGANISGFTVANTPDSILAVTNPEALATRETVEEVVQRNLRLVLGAQFTEKEGERLISRAYNPRLSEEENAKRVTRLIEQMRSAAASKRSAINYYEENGTLKGWDGKLPTADDLDPTKPKPVTEMTDAELEAIAYGN